MINKDAGLSIHCHHDLLIEYCTSYDERVDYIKKNKPIHEREIRLRVFKLLSDEAIAALPKGLVRANADWEKADADRQKAYADWQKAAADWQKADADRQKAGADWQKSDADWQKADADRQKAYADREKAYADRRKAYADRQKADADWQKADADWPQQARDAWHKKWCGCSEWNGKELVFKKLVTKRKIKK